MRSTVVPAICLEPNALDALERMAPLISLAKEGSPLEEEAWMKEAKSFRGVCNNARWVQPTEDDVDEEDIGMDPFKQGEPLTLDRLQRARAFLSMIVDQLAAQATREWWVEAAGGEALTPDGRSIADAMAANRKVQHDMAVEAAGYLYQADLDLRGVIALLREESRCRVAER